jgi:hypothetical protein
MSADGAVWKNGEELAREGVLMYCRAIKVVSKN